MHVYVLKRILAVVPVLLGLTVIVFAIMALIPGDPAIAILGSYATPENVARLNRDLGLDKPLVQQYFIWLENLCGVTSAVPTASTGRSSTKCGSASPRH